ncbi:uncharacterized [Tachysurus ichikawai]
MRRHSSRQAPHQEPCRRGKNKGACGPQREKKKMNGESKTDQEYKDESSNPVVKRFDTTSYERASRFFLYARTFDIVLFAEPSCWWER